MTNRSKGKSNTGKSNKGKSNKGKSNKGKDNKDGLTYDERIRILPGDPRIAYRPLLFALKHEDPDALRTKFPDHLPDEVAFDQVFDDDEPDGSKKIWWTAKNVADPVAAVAQLRSKGEKCHLHYVYFANAACCGTCPPHPALATVIAANPWGANPWGANPWGANPWGANPWGANPWGANPWGANPWGANAEALNLVATGKPPMSTAMPARVPTFPTRPFEIEHTVFVDVLDSGLAGLKNNERPDELKRPHIEGDLDHPSTDNDHYLDPVAGHGTFIAGIVEQLTPGCRIVVKKVFKPQGDVSVDVLAQELRKLLKRHDKKQLARTIVNLSFGGTGSTPDGCFEEEIARYEKKGVVFVAAAGNEGTCVEQYPAALDNVIGVAALAPTGPADWSNYGSWVNACAPGTDLVSSFFANFDGKMPRINGMDPDNFKSWATWTGTSFAAPVVVAALAREMGTTGCTAVEAVKRVIDAPHLARLPNMGTIVNY